MKRIIIFIIMLISACGRMAMAQETPPAAQYLKSVNAQFYMDSRDSSVWHFKGAPYGWERLGKYKDVAAKLNISDTTALLRKTTAAATYAKLSGGNAFSGNQAMNDVLYVGASGNQNVLHGGIYDGSFAHFSTAANPEIGTSPSVPLKITTGTTGWLRARGDSLEDHNGNQFIKSAGNGTTNLNLSGNLVVNGQDKTISTNGMTLFGDFTAHGLGYLIGNDGTHQYGINWISHLLSFGDSPSFNWAFITSTGIYGKSFVAQGTGGEGTISPSLLTGNRAYSLPNKSGVLATTDDIPATGSFIQNQTIPDLAQVANFNINGSGVFGDYIGGNFSAIAPNSINLYSTGANIVLEPGMVTAYSSSTGNSFNINTNVSGGVKYNSSTYSQFDGPLRVFLAPSDPLDVVRLSDLSGYAPATGSTTYLSKTGDTMTGDLLLASASPTDPLSAAPKVYIDNLITGITWKNAVRVKTTGNITLSGTQTIDGVALAVGNRVLVNDQTDATQNGIYLVASGSWTRPTDADSGDELWTSTVAVTNGTVNKNTQWTCLNTTSPIIGTDNITYGQISGAGTYNASSGIDLTGNTFTLNQPFVRGLFSAGTGLSYNSSTGVFSTSSIPNSSLTNSTISGVSLGSSLAGLSATNSTLSFSGTYDGSAARTIGLNLGNANTWTATQTIQINNLGYNGSISGTTTSLTSLGAISVDNTTAATASILEQYPGLLLFNGNYWDGSTSQPHKYAMQFGGNGSGTNGSFKIMSRRGTGNWITMLQIDALGQFEAPVKYAFYGARATLNDGFVLSNAEAATVSYNQNSPLLRLSTQGWKTGATAGSQYMTLVAMNSPETGVTNPVGVHKVIFGTNSQSASTSNELYRLEWGDRLGFKINSLGLANFTTSITGLLDVNGTAKATQFRLSALNTAPSSSTDTGTLGEIRVTSTYLYVCTATNTWVRSAFSTF